MVFPVAGFHAPSYSLSSLLDAPDKTAVPAVAPIQDLSVQTRAALAGWYRESAAPVTESRDVSARFGQRLRQLRLERRMTQLDMAKRFGIDRSFISDVERGRKSMTLPMLEVIAIGMDMSLSKLFENI